MSSGNVIYSSMTPEQLAEARGWISDCEWADDIDTDTLTDRQVERGIARHYDGGIAQFNSDVA
jgi:hypothetical protein